VQEALSGCRGKPALKSWTLQVESAKSSESTHVHILVEEWIVSAVARLIQCPGSSCYPGC
jgi:hypothetical protein